MEPLLTGEFACPPAWATYRIGDVWGAKGTSAEGAPAPSLRRNFLSWKPELVPKRSERNCSRKMSTPYGDQQGQMVEREGSFIRFHGAGT